MIMAGGVVQTKHANTKSEGNFSGACCVSLLSLFCILEIWVNLPLQKPKVFAKASYVITVTMKTNIY